MLKILNSMKEIWIFYYDVCTCACVGLFTFFIGIHYFQDCIRLLNRSEKFIRGYRIFWLKIQKQFCDISSPVVRNEKTAFKHYYTYYKKKKNNSAHAPSTKCSEKSRSRLIVFRQRSFVISPEFNTIAPYYCNTTRAQRVRGRHSETTFRHRAPRRTRVLGRSVRVN